MALDYKFNIKDGMFEYKCITYGSYIEIRAKDAKKIYNILNKLDNIEKLRSGSRRFFPIVRLWLWLAEKILDIIGVLQDHERSL